MSQEYDSLYLAVEATADAMTVRTYSVSAEGAQSLMDTYTMRVPASVCRDKGHDFSGKTVYARNGKLVCSFCGQTVELKDAGYTGWAGMRPPACGCIATTTPGTPAGSSSTLRCIALTRTVWPTTER